MMKILVTGSLGFYRFYPLLELQNNGHEGNIN